MKKQITIVFVASIFITGLLAIFIFMRREKEIGLQWLTENSRSQLDLMGDLIDSDLEKMKGQLARVATMMEAGQTEEAQRILGVFLGVAAVDLESSAYLWTVQSKAEGTAPSKDEWSAQWIAKLREAKSDDNDVRFYASQNAEGDVRSAVSLIASVRDRKSGQVNKVRLIGMTSKALFQELVDKLKVQGVHVFLTTPSGLTLAHTVSEYVGNSMVGDRTYEEIRKQKNIFGSIVTKDVRGDDILSFYVKLPAGKLTLVSQWRKELWVTTDWTYYGQGFFILGALALLFGAFGQYLLNRIQEGPVREVTVEKIVERIIEKVVEKPGPIPSAATGVSVSVAASNLDTIPSTVPSTVPSLATLTPTSSGSISLPETLPIPTRPASLFTTPAPKTPEAREPQVSMKTLERVVAALRAPLLSVLGHVQIARLNPQGGSLQAIETEVRNARDVLDRVGQFSGQAQVPSVTVPLYEVIEAALRSVEGALLRGSIKIVRELPVDLAVKCDIDELKGALAAIIRNSVEAMEKNLRKTLTLRATKQNGMINLEIEDTGEGILPENMEKVFEPFFTTRSAVEHRGLGLSMASGVLRQHGAQVQVKSKVGEGTLITVKVPHSTEVVQSLSDRGISTRIVKEFKTPSLEALGESVGITAAAMPVTNQEAAPVAATASVPSMVSGEATVSPTASSLDAMNIFDEEDEDSFGDFQFGRLDFAEPKSGTSPVAPEMTEYSRGEQIALEVIKEVQSMAQGASDDSHQALPSSSPVKRLKKKEEPLAKMKVQIPRPEERL